MINKSHIIFYVEDQQKSTEFYSQLLNLKPTLNVPGMTEFTLIDNAVLGLMPAAGIKKLLKEKIELPQKTINTPRAEIYLVVDNAEEYIRRAQEMKVAVIDEFADRNWGHRAIYYEDLDGYIIVFAEEIKGIDLQTL